jgi:hypothetical protein
MARHNIKYQMMKIKILLTLLIGLIAFKTECQEKAKKSIGIIGLDTSHSISFAAMFNGSEAKPEFGNYHVTVAYPWGSKTIEEGYSRVPGFVEKAKELGIKIADSIEELLSQVDYVLLETQDGNVHIEQALAVFKAGKPVFIDKPMAANLSDVCLIYELGKRYNVPVFTTSSLRYTEPLLEISDGKKGKVLGSDCFGPCQEEPSHASLFWYGIHGVEMLFTIMGTGCQSVTRTHTWETDIVTGIWNDKRVGTYRGMRIGTGPYYHFGGFAYCEKEAVPLDNYKGYGFYELTKELVKFFETGIVPVTAETTIEIYAFMEASNQSIINSGRPVRISKVIKEAKKGALKQLKKYEQTNN